MKYFSTLLAVLLITLLFNPQKGNAQHFEGTIHYDIPALAESGMSDMKYMVKKPNLRMELNKDGRKIAVLFYPKKSKMMVLISAMNAYMKMDTKDDNDQSNADDIKVTKTDKTKTIAGKSCQVWEIKSDEYTMEDCMAKDMGTFILPKSPMGQNKQPEWAEELGTNGAMPLEVVKIKNGSRKTKLRATKIEDKSLSADLFEVPDGYRDMSGMMNQRKQ